MIKYTYELSEEIARWSTEIYIKQHPELGWWIAFTNPTAGPWKKIIAPTQKGTNVEIHRFVREGERPDLILVNDQLKIILVVEAKDDLSKLVTKDQMTKSIRVIDQMSILLKNITNEHWQTRKNYRTIASFLWVCQNQEDIIGEDRLVRASFDKYGSPHVDTYPLNIIVYKEQDGVLHNSFVYGGTVYLDLSAPFRKP